MYIDLNNHIVQDDAPFVGLNGTQYPANFPKSEIAELTPVTLTVQPATTQYQDADYTIVNVTQVWTVTDWSAERIAAYQKMLVPASVDARQARRALLAIGMLGAVNNAIAAMTGAEGDAARVDWEFAPNIRRDNQLVVALSAMLGLTDEQLDQLFIAAGAIQ